MTTPGTDEHRIAELRAEWHRARSAGDAERLAHIEDEADRIKALRAITAVFPAAVVLEANDTAEETQP